MKELLIFNEKINPKKENKSNSFLYQTIHTIFSKVGLLIIGILTGILTARVLKPEGKGLLTMFQVIPGMVVAFGELGIRQSTAYLIGQKSYNEKDIQASMVALYFISAFVSICIIFVGYWIFGIFKYGFLMSVVFASTAPIALLNRYSTGLLLGRKQIEKFNYIQLIRTCGGFIFLLFLVAWLKWGVAGAGIGLLLAQVVAVAILLSWINRYASLKPKWIQPIPNQILSKGILFALSLFVLSLNYRLDVIMLAKIQNEAHVGIYSVGVSICELLKEVPLAIGVVLFSRSTNWSPKNVQKSLDKTAFVTRTVLAFSLISALLLLSVVWWLIPLFYGTSYQESERVVWYLLPGILSITFFISINLFVAGQGKPEFALYAFGPALLVNILLNFYLIPKWSYIGAACSSSISYLFGVIIYLIIFRNHYKIRIFDFIYPRKEDFYLLWERIKGSIKI